MAREPLPPPQPPKPARRPNFRPNQSQNQQQKRKRPADDDPSANVNGYVPGVSDRRPRAKKPRPQKKEKPRKEGGGGGGGGGDGKKTKAARIAADEADLDYDLGLNRAFARMDAPALADHLARQTKRFGQLDDLSAVELADLAVGAGAVRDTSSYGKDRTLANLPDFLEAAAEGEGGKKALLAAPSANGAPHTIVVTGAGLRAADLVRALRPLQSQTSTVSKLFAKHIKLSEAVAFLQSRRTGIAVGTPARLIDLLDHGALSVAHLRRIVVDASHIDVKKRGVLDMRETALPVARWLARPEFQARYCKGGAEEESGDKDKSEKPLSILFY